MEWISVDDRIEFGKDVLVYDGHGMGIGSFHHGGSEKEWGCYSSLYIGWDGDWESDTTITHWMPLPAPPCTTPDDDANKPDDTTEPVQADEQVAEPDQLYCACNHVRHVTYDGMSHCEKCGKPLAG